MRTVEILRVTSPQPEVLLYEIWLPPTSPFSFLFILFILCFVLPPPSPFSFLFLSHFNLLPQTLSLWCGQPLLISLKVSQVRIVVRKDWKQKAIRAEVGGWDGAFIIHLPPRSHLVSPSRFINGSAPAVLRNLDFLSPSRLWLFFMALAPPYLFSGSFHFHLLLLIISSPSQFLVQIPNKESDCIKVLQRSRTKRMCRWMERQMEKYISYLYICIYKETYYKKFSHMDMDAKSQILQLAHCKPGKSWCFSSNPKAEINWCPSSRKSDRKNILFLNLCVLFSF